MHCYNFNLTRIFLFFHSEKRLMISYQWDSQSFVLQIKDQLEEFGYNTWMDIDKMHGNIYAKMAEGVENSKIIIVCMSTKYECSKNCNSELHYAQDNNRKIIPIKVEAGYRPKSALGLITAGKIYVDFSDPAKFDDNMKLLRNEIDEHLGDQGKQ